MVGGTMENAVKDLNFEGHEFFTYDDYNLFFRLGPSCRPVTEARLKADRYELAMEAKNPLSQGSLARAAATQISLD